MIHVRRRDDLSPLRMYAEGIAAKGIIRKDDYRENSLYFLACTMVNFTYSIFIGMLMLFFLEIS